MRARRDGTVVVSPMPWRRSLAFALVAVGVGLGGHVLSSGHAIHPLTVLVAFAATLGLARLTAHLRRRALPLAIATGGMQVATHVVLTLLGGHAAVSAGVAPSAHAMHMHHGMEHAAAASAGMSPLAMVAFHLVAAVLGVLVLLELERRVWGATVAVARRALRSVGAWLGLDAAPARAPRSLGAAPRIITVLRAAPHHASWHALTGVRRGPPVLPAS